MQTKPVFPQGKVRVYRVEVTYPTANIMVEMAEAGFKWPRNRRYITQDSAEARARLFREYGAEARVVASKPVEWEE